MIHKLFHILGILFLCFGATALVIGVAILAALPNITNPLNCDGPTPDWFCNKGWETIVNAKSQLRQGAYVLNVVGSCMLLPGIGILWFTVDD